MNFTQIRKDAIDYKIERLKQVLELYYQADYSPFISHYQEEIKSILLDITNLVL